MDLPHVQRRITVVLLVGCLLLGTTSGVVAAAVSGEFSATYDGYGDGESTDAPGHEIATEGQMEVTGDPAVNPIIVVKSGQSTVLDTDSVEVFVEGDRSIQFDRTYEAGEVRLSTSEIPAETTLRIEYRTYYIGGADSATVTSSQVEFNYDQPSGDRTRETFDVEATLDNRPEDFVQQANSNAQLSQVQALLSYVGAGGIVLLFVGLALKALGNGGPPDGPGPN